jgi:hypothetical protein
MGLEHLMRIVHTLTGKNPTTSSNNQYTHEEKINDDRTIHMGRRSMNIKLKYQKGMTIATQLIVGGIRSD